MNPKRKYIAAFPRPASEDRRNGSLPDGDSVVDEQDGMDLRDYFAAKAMQGFLSCRPTVGNEEAGHVAFCAYYYADAMLEARKA